LFSDAVAMVAIALCTYVLWTGYAPARNMNGHQYGVAACSVLHCCMPDTIQAQFCTKITESFSSVYLKS